MIISAIWIFSIFVGLLEVVPRQAWNPPRQFPKGHIREYDPEGIYTYKDQNPRFR